MPLEFVTSNAGHPMLVIDKYTFHRHSTSAKTGRTNWRCSRRRVKDIRCNSSCNTTGSSAAADTATQPSPHDPSCRPHTNAELMAMQAKQSRLGTLPAAESGPSLSQSQSQTNGNDCTIANIFDESALNGDETASQDRELDDDDINNVLDGYENSLCLFDADGRSVVSLSRISEANISKEI